MKFNPEFLEIIHASYTPEEVDDIQRRYNLLSESILAKRAALRELLRKRGYGW